MSKPTTNGIIKTSCLGSSSSDCNMVSCKMTSGCEMSNDQMSNGNNHAGSKLSKIGRRIRDSCRNLRGKHPSGGASSNPEDFSSLQAPNESSRSLHYVPMDFSTKSGRIISQKDIQGQMTKEGYTYFRRKIEPTNVDHLLTETQATIHKDQPWFHKGVSRELSQKILASHCIDGLFLVRESSVAGGFVISYFFGGRAYHVPIMPITTGASIVTYSLDEGKTKFFDLLQLVEFYQLNQGSLNVKLAHYVVSNASISARSESPVDSQSCKNASDASLDSKSLQASEAKGIDSNHNKEAEATSKSISSSEDDSVATAVDANMASEDEEA